MARYVFVNKVLAIEKGLITEDTVRQISKDGKTVCLIEDDLLRFGSDIEDAIESVDGVALEQHNALKRIHQEF